MGSRQAAARQVIDLLVLVKVGRLELRPTSRSARADGYIGMMTCGFS
jgi:hypothetical protein